MTVLPVIQRVRLMPPSNLLDNHRAGGKTYVHAEITGPVITGEQSLSEQTHYMKEHQWENQSKECFRVGPSVAAHNRSMIKGEFRRQKSSRQVAI